MNQYCQCISSLKTRIYQFYQQAVIVLFRRFPLFGCLFPLVTKKLSSPQIIAPVQNQQRLASSVWKEDLSLVKIMFILVMSAETLLTALIGYFLRISLDYQSTYLIYDACHSCSWGLSTAESVCL